MSSTTTFVLAGRSNESDLRALLRPLPPALDHATGEAATAHRNLAERFGQARSKAIAASQKLEEAVIADDEAARKAIESGLELPKATKSEKARAALDEATRELALVSEVVESSARQLLDAALPIAGEVAERVASEADELEAEALGLLAQARQLLVESDAARAQATWSSGLANGGAVRPFTHHDVVGPGANAVNEAKLAIEQEARRREERRAAYEHDLVALNSIAGRRLPEPPSHDELSAA